MSIFENVVYALRIDGVRNKSLLEDICERSLRGAALWDEVKDRLNESALVFRWSAATSLHRPRDRR